VGAPVADFGFCGLRGERAWVVTRALAVSLSVSAGFLSVFIVIGAISKWSTRWFLDKADYARWLDLSADPAALLAPSPEGTLKVTQA
jgi:hypothetical protein